MKCAEMWKSEYQQLLDCGIPKLNFRAVKADNNMTTIWCLAEAGDRAFIVIHTDKF